MTCSVVAKGYSLQIWRTATDTVNRQLTRELWRIAADIINKRTADKGVMEDSCGCNEQADS
jgi:hypothetical protein